MERPVGSRSLRHWRADVTAPMAFEQHNVLSRSQLRGLGIHRHDVRAEIVSGRWLRMGTQSVAVSRELDEVSRRWAAVFEVGAGACLDGVTSLEQTGLTGWRHHTIDISVPHGAGHR